MRFKHAVIKSMLRVQMKITKFAQNIFYEPFEWAFGNHM